jgi:hypothetical protein
LKPAGTNNACPGWPFPGWGLSLASPAPDGLAAVRHLALIYDPQGQITNAGACRPVRLSSESIETRNQKDIVTMGITLRMRILPAGFIAPCLPTKPRCACRAMPPPGRRHRRGGLSYDATNPPPSAGGKDVATTARSSASSARTRSIRSRMVAASSTAHHPRSSSGSSRGAASSSLMSNSEQ